MQLLSVSGIQKNINGTFMLRQVSFIQSRGMNIAIAGETGSGKSTLLKIIAGLEQPDSGTVLFNGERVRGPLEELVPGHPKIAYLSQHFELRNNYRVEELLEYANKIPEETAINLYKVCRIDHLVKRKTDQLSGGEKQRIALARLLTTSPELLLLDEPFSNLDMIHKQILKTVIRDIGAKLGISCIMVSHDPLDTLPWADEMMIMRNGEIIQSGTPAALYYHPSNEYVAALLGHYTLLDASFAGMDSGKKILLRPEQIILSEKGKYAGIVNRISFLGSGYEIEIKAGNEYLLAKTNLVNFSIGDTVLFSFAEGLSIFG